MNLTLYRVSAFPQGALGGNEAGVVLEAEGLSEEEMLAIAKRVNYSETAFLLPSELADFKLRYFSPTVEVPLCGHATIATFNLMRNLDMIEEKTYTIETKEGILNVKIEADMVYLQLAKPKFKDTVDTKDLKELGLDLNELNDYKPCVVSTGINEIFVGVKSLDYLNALALDEEKILALCKKHDSLGLYVYTLETKFDADAHGRNFIPTIGVYEESATGTASGALACYLNRYVDQNKLAFTFEQGYALYKPSTIIVKLTKDHEKITDIYVGGRMRFIDKIVGFNPNQAL
ncbi:MAG: PhzF family phenazine biosynthesis protein [Candidatus Izemoplasmataceae bacterium]